MILQNSEIPVPIPRIKEQTRECPVFGFCIIYVGVLGQNQKCIFLLRLFIIFYKFFVDSLLQFTSWIISGGLCKLQNSQRHFCKPISNCIQSSGL